MEQAIIKIGNSIGIILPQHLSRKIGVKVGDKVIVDEKGGSFKITPLKKKKSAAIDVKFSKMVDEFLTEHSDVLEELSRR